MTVLEFLLLLLVAGICGAIGQAITGYTAGGLLVCIALGFIGALLGMGISRALGLEELFVVEFDSTRFPIVWSIIGSALFVAFVALLARPSRTV